MTESTAERRVGPGLAERTEQAMVWRREEVFGSQEGERARVAGAQGMRWGQGVAGVGCCRASRWDLVFIQRALGSPNLCFFICKPSFLPVIFGMGGC